LDSSILERVSLISVTTLSRLTTDGISAILRSFIKIIWCTFYRQ